MEATNASDSEGGIVIAGPGGEPFRELDDAQDEASALGGTVVQVPDGWLVQLGGADSAAAPPDRDREPTTVPQLPGGLTPSQAAAAAERFDADIRPGDVLSPHGRPFMLRSTAIAEAERLGAEAVQVGRGWVVRAAQEESDAELQPVAPADQGTDFEVEDLAPQPAGEALPDFPDAAVEEIQPPPADPRDPGPLPVLTDEAGEGGAEQGPGAAAIVVDPAAEPEEGAASLPWSDLDLDIWSGRGEQSPLDEMAHAAATSPLNDRREPTEAQKLAGNYRKAHLRISGLDISIENPEHSQRTGVDRDGKEWSRTMASHYGYIRSTEARDGDQVDVFIKPGTLPSYSGPVFIVDQVHPDTKLFDEHKVMLGWPTIGAARQAYRAHYDEGWKGLGAITKMSMPEFKEWVAEGKHRLPVDRSKVRATPKREPRSALERAEAALRSLRQTNGEASRV